MFGGAFGEFEVVGDFVVGDILGHDDEDAGESVDLDVGVPVLLGGGRADVADEGDAVYGAAGFEKDVFLGGKQVGGGERGVCNLAGVGVPLPCATVSFAGEVPLVERVEFLDERGVVFAVPGVEVGVAAEAIGGHEGAGVV